MDVEIKQYKKVWFVKPDPRKIPFSLYPVRVSLINAVTEFRNKISGNLVDLGCGVMPYKEFLLEAPGVTGYTGIDLAPTEYHNKTSPDLHWDGINIPLDNNTVDNLMVTEFLEHYHDTAHILKEIYRVLRPGGLLFFTVPFVWPLHESPYDEYRFTPFNLQKRFNEAGFRSFIIKPLGGFHQSMAIMIGLWLEKSGVSGVKQRMFAFFLKPFYKWLLKSDYKYDELKNDCMYSGLYGFVNK